MSSSCSRRISDSAPADDSTGRPSARRRSISCAFLAAARAFLSQMPTAAPWKVAFSGARRCPFSAAHPRAADRPSSHATSKCDQIMPSFSGCAMRSSSISPRA